MNNERLEKQISFLHFAEAAGESLAINATASPISSIAGSVISILKAMFGRKIGKDIFRRLRSAFLDGLFSGANRGNKAGTFQLLLSLLVRHGVNQNCLHLSVDGKKHRLVRIVDVLDKRSGVTLKIR